MHSMCIHKTLFTCNLVFSVPIVGLQLLPDPFTVATLPKYSFHEILSLAKVIQKFISSGVSYRTFGVLLTIYSRCPHIFKYWQQRKNPQST